MVLAVVACEEQTPTGLRQELPSEPVSVELELTWSEFASNLEVLGGYGAPVQLGVGVLASDFEGTLNARTLLRFGGYPDSATVFIKNRQPVESGSGRGHHHRSGR